VRDICSLVNGRHDVMTAETDTSLSRLLLTSRRNCSRATVNVIRRVPKTFTEQHAADPVSPDHHVTASVWTFGDKHSDDDERRPCAAMAVRPSFFSPAYDIADRSVRFTRRPFFFQPVFPALSAETCKYARDFGGNASDSDKRLDRSFPVVGTRGLQGSGRRRGENLAATAD